MSTNTATKITKADLIARLVLVGGFGSARHLRDSKHAELVAITEQVEADALAAYSEAVAESEMADETAPEAVAVEGGPILANAYYTVAEVAEMVGLTKFAVRRWVRLGYLANAEVEQSTRKGQFHVLGADLAPFLLAREEKRTG